MISFKRIISFILSFVFVALLYGCEHQYNNKSVFNYNSDMQIYYHRNGSNNPITKSENGYYYVGDDNILIYVDKESLSATPLCFEPNCLHDDPKDCNAYFNISEYIPPNSNIGTAIQYYEGHLYMVCGEFDESGIEYHTYLMRCDKDGSNRTKISEYFDCNFYDWFIHRNYFYYTNDNSIMRIPISSPKNQPEIIYQCNYFIENSMNTFQLMCAYNNYFYATVMESDNNGNGSGMVYIVINLDTLEVNQLPSFDDNASFYREFIDNNLIMQYLDKDTQEYVYLKSELDGSNAKDFYKEQSSLSCVLTADGNYFYSDNVLGINNNSKISDQIITVYDKNMNKVDSFKLPKTTQEYNYFFTPQDNEYFLFETVNSGGEIVLSIADKSQIGSIKGNTIEYKELCKLDWYENSDNPYVSYAE